MDTHRWVAQVMLTVQRGVDQTTTSITKTKPRSKASGLVRFLGLACLAGGLLWWASNITEAFGLPPGPPIVEGPLGVLMLVGLMGGPLGFLALRAAGKGRTGRAGLDRVSF